MQGLSGPPLVFVSITGQDSKQQRAQLYSRNNVTNDGLTTFTSSGILLSPHFVVTTITSLYPFISDTQQANLHSITRESLPPTVRIKCLITAQDSINKRSTTKTIPASLISIIYDEKCSQSLQQLISSPSLAQGQWSIAWNGVDLPPRVAAHFVVLQLQAPYIQQHYKSNIDVESMASDVWIGTPVSAISCPFGALAGDHFQGFVSTGIISAVLCVSNSRKNNKQQNIKRLNSDSTATVACPLASMFLGDFKSLPGSEGCPVYKYKNGRIELIGMALPPLKASNLHEAEFQPIMPASSFLSVIGQHLDNKNTIFNTSLPHYNNNISVASSSSAGGSVVAIRAGSGWASGLQIDDCHIVTCSHAVNSPAGNSSVSNNKYHIKRHGVDAPWIEAKLVHDFHTSANSLDLAILKLLRSSPMQEERLKYPFEDDSNESSIIEVSDSIAVVGYPIWHPRADIGPLATSGNIAKIIHCPSSSANDTSTPATHNNTTNSQKQQPAMLLTTASVFNGVSGGAVINQRTGKIVGMVTSNAKVRKTEIFPTLNFSIPINILQLAVDAVVNGNTEAMRELKGIEQEIRAIWSLERSLNISDDDDCHEDLVKPKHANQFLDRLQSTMSKL